jgi:hypothetical protein
MTTPGLLAALGMAATAPADTTPERRRLHHSHLVLLLHCNGGRQPMLVGVLGPQAVSLDHNVSRGELILLIQQDPNLPG